MSTNVSSNPFRTRSLSMGLSFIPADNTSCGGISRQPADVHTETPHFIHGQRNIPKRTNSQSSPKFPDPASFQINKFERVPNSVRIVDSFHGSNIDTSLEHSNDDDLVKSSIIPVNPFESTSKASEQYSKGEVKTLFKQNRLSPRRQSLDTHKLKRLLTRSLNPSINQINRDEACIPANTGDSGTKKMVVGQHAILESILEPDHELSQTPNNELEPEEYQRDLNISMLPSRQKPPPPSSRHGKLIKVQLKDDLSPGFTESVRSPDANGSPIQLTNSCPHSGFNYLQNNLNRPLPLASSKTSKDLEHHTLVFPSIKKKTLPKSNSVHHKRPPTPPLSRRHSQSITKISNNHIGFSPNSNEEIGSHLIGLTDQNSTLSRSNSVNAPLPPPSRRSGISQSLVENKSSRTSKSPATPTRKSSHSGRRSNTGNSHLPTILSANVHSSKKQPPPLPQREVQIDSISRRDSVESVRRRDSIKIFQTGESDYPHTSKDNVVVGEKVIHKSKINILADLSQLQKEIDELRAKKEEKAVV
ncbi:hypothetical protein K3495_g12714 [Podosphaera aphanis]|nr:hypothetical protein K3495_g12714 [Podosphaera aphanis]